VPGYEPFLLCDFRVHTRWSDGRLSLRDVVDLYGRTGRFDVIAITDHMDRGLPYSSESHVASLKSEVARRTSHVARRAGRRPEFGEG
jgi:histidinol phosphatase-like PHP family hydrolase